MIAVFSVIMIPSLMWGSKITPLFLIAWIVAIALCIPTGTTYKEMQEGVIKNCTKAIVPALIILCVGGLVGTWTAAGTVPMIISFGVKAISPQAFLLTSFLLCAVCALVTGTSWGTFGTAGLALAGIGAGLNVDPVMTAGAVCAGAFFGDTISPMSDSPNLASAVSGVDLFKGIKHQAKVTIPAAMGCCGIYYVLGLKYKGGKVDEQLIDSIVNTIENNFNLGFMAMIPVILVVVLLIIKVPSIPALLTSGIAGGVVACAYQGNSLKDTIQFFWEGYTMESGVEFIDQLLNRGGIMSMASTAIMFFFAFGLFGILSSAGIVEGVVEPFTKRLKSKISLVVSTVVLSVFGTIIGASMNFAYAFAGSIMEPIYKERGIRPEDLMRALGVGCTAMTVLVPWSLSAVVAAPFLGVKTTQLFQYNFFLYLAPLVLVMVTIFCREKSLQEEVSEN